jgi:hypothetical protein
MLISVGKLIFHWCISPGTVGSDVWALAWMLPWFQYSENPMSNDKSRNALLCDAFSSIRQSSQWVTVTNGSNSMLYPQKYLHPGDFGSKIFPLSDEMTTSFYPMLQKQFEAHCHDSVHNSADVEDIYRYFESNMGTLQDTNNDGVQDSYLYNTLLPTCNDEVICQLGNYSVWATATLLMGMVIPPSAYEFVNDMFVDLPLFRKMQGQPKVIFVDRPMIVLAKCTASGPICRIPKCNGVSCRVFISEIREMHTEQRKFSGLSSIHCSSWRL